jgi:hypothetical protein
MAIIVLLGMLLAVFTDIVIRPVTKGDNHGRQRRQERKAEGPEAKAGSGSEEKGTTEV